MYPPGGTIDKDVGTQPAWAVGLSMGRWTLSAVQYRTEGIVGKHHSAAVLNKMAQMCLVLNSRGYSGSRPHSQTAVGSAPNLLALSGSHCTSHQ